MVDECVRFLFARCEGSLDERSTPSGHTEYISTLCLRTGVKTLGGIMSANQNAHTIFFTCKKKSYNQSKRSYDKFHM